MPATQSAPTGGVGDDATEEPALAATAPDEPGRGQRRPVVRQFLAQGFVNLASLIIGLFLVALIVPADGRPLADSLEFALTLLPALAVFALVLTLLQRVLHPLLVIVFGAVVLRTFGLFLLFIDMIVFVIAVWLTPLPLPFDADTWWGIPVATLLFDLVSFTLMTLLGLNRPWPDPVRPGAGVWQVLGRVPSSRRNWINERVRQPEVLATMLEYGIEIGLGDGVLARFRRRCWRLLYRRTHPIDGMSAAAKTRIMLQQLGPAYVKFGQMISTQTQLLSDEWNTEMERLQSNVPPVGFDEVRQVVIREFGAPPEELFARIDETPVAAASTAQVHRAERADGRVVAVKIQRPDIQARVKADLGVLEDIVTVIENVSRRARQLQLSKVLGQFADAVVRELDYRNEAYHMARMSQDMDAVARVRVPSVHHDLSASRVLTMDFVDGVALRRGLALEPEQATILTEAVIRSFVKQIFVDGFFHADPHPGNFLIDREDGSIVILDLGLVGVLDKGRRMDLIDLIVCLQENDSAELADLAVRMCTTRDEIDVTALRTDLAEMVNQHVRYAQEPTFDSMTGALIPVLARHGLRLDEQFTLAIKAVAQAQDVVLLLDGEIDFLPFIVHELRALAVAEFGPEQMLAGLRQRLLRAGRHLARSMNEEGSPTGPSLLGGRITIRVDTRDLNEHLDTLNVTVARFAAGLLIIGMIVGTAILAIHVSQLMVLFIALLLLGARLAYTVLRPRRR
ncbi:MAG: AarF/UbiB family protein [Microbacterium sp.]